MISRVDFVSYFFPRWTNSSNNSYNNNNNDAVVIYGNSTYNDSVTIPVMINYHI